MKREKLIQALDQISDAHIAEAAAPRKKRKLLLLPAIAACAALVLLLNIVEIPMVIAAETVSAPSDPRLYPRPEYGDYDNREQWVAELDAWTAARDQRDATTLEALGRASSFLKDSCRIFLTGSEENLLYSPANAYFGLAMAAELSAGSTRQQLLDALGAQDITVLRSYAEAIWESAYYDDGGESCTLANSLWLDNELEFNQEIMDSIAYYHYASVYRKDLQSSSAAKSIQAWLSNNTRGMLDSAVKSIELPKEAILALYSTIYFQSKWQEEFRAANNTQDTFHAPNGDITCTFMNQKLVQMNYYWGESYGAVNMGLKNGSDMWFILPDPDKTVADVLSQGEYLDMIAARYGEWEKMQYMKVNLSVPKFNIQSQRDLRSGLEQMGITELFDLEHSDFSAAFSGPAHITGANQAVRVEIDEQGVKAAAYIELPMAGAAAPPEEIIDFILDRPFLFVVADGTGIPLFAGTVNQP